MQKTVEQYRIRRGKKVRLIYNPSPTYKYLLKKIKKYLDDKLPVHPSSYGWVPGRSTKDAVAQIVHFPYKIEIDIHDFFHSIPLSRLEKMLEKYLPLQTVKRIMYFCTYDGKVPQGFPTSSTLANFYRYEIDERIFVLAAEYGYIYVNYGDNLIFGGEKIHYDFIQKAHQLIESYGLSINRRKTRVYKDGQRQKILGVIVNKKLNFPKREYERLYDQLYKQRLLSLNQSIAGQLSYYAWLNPIKFQKLFQRLNHMVELKIIT